MTKTQKLTQLVEDLAVEREKFTQASEKLAKMGEEIAKNKKEVGEIMEFITSKVKDTEFKEICSPRIMRKIYDCGKEVGRLEKASLSLRAYTDSLEKRCTDIWNTLYETSKQ